MARAKCDIVLCNVPITPTHQLSFDSDDERFDFFNAHKVREFLDCRYQPRNGTMRVKAYVDELLDCNYGYYVNSYNGKSKIFYFFIAARDYVSMNTTELTIQLDVFQTWYNEMNLQQCFIERAMTDDDSIGNNTVPEDFEVGDYIFTSSKVDSLLTSDVNYVIAYSEDIDGNTGGGIFGKQYSGLKYRVFTQDNVSGLNSFIQSLADAGKSDAICYIFTFPKNFMESATGLSGANYTLSGYEGFLRKEETANFENDKSFSYNDMAYEPYNNKLYTYPYSFITICNSNGSNIIIKNELNGNGLTLKYYLDGCITPNPVFTLTPENYDGQEIAYQDSISEQSFGLCSWNNDNYANWYANNQNTLRATSANASRSYGASQRAAQSSYDTSKLNAGITAAQGAIGAVGSLLNLQIGSAITGGVNTALDYTKTTNTLNTDLSNTSLLNSTNYQNTISSLMASIEDAQVQPNTAKGDTSACGLDLARGTATFFIKNTKIKPEFAKRIDMFFQMYGYQMNCVDKPSKYVYNRVRWNYVKTVGAVVTGEIPHADREAIEDILNNGLTIWHDVNYMFKYDVENPIIQVVEGEV